MIPMLALPEIEAKGQAIAKPPVINPFSSEQVLRESSRIGREANLCAIWWR
jgi:hypothetical protein